MSDDAYQKLRDAQIQSGDVATIIGKRVAAFAGGDLLDRYFALAFDDGTYLRLKVGGWEDHYVEVSDDTPDDDEQLALGLVTSEEHAARRAAKREVERQQQEAQERRTLDELKRKYGA